MRKLPPSVRILSLINPVRSTSSHFLFGLEPEKFSLQFAILNDKYCLSHVSSVRVRKGCLLYTFQYYTRKELGALTFTVYVHHKGSILLRFSYLQTSEEGADRSGSFRTYLSLGQDLPSEMILQNVVKRERRRAYVDSIDVFVYATKQVFWQSNWPFFVFILPLILPLTVTLN
jgi:hypothetical protein